MITSNCPPEIKTLDRYRGRASIMIPAILSIVLIMNWRFTVNQVIKS